METLHTVAEIVGLAFIAVVIVGAIGMAVSVVVYALLSRRFDDHSE